MKLLPTPLLVLAATVTLPSTPPPVVAPPVAAPQGPFAPGPEHALLQTLVGTWNAVLIARDPSGAEQRTQGTLVTTKSAAFHTLDSFEGTFLGMTMVGHGMNGYCTVRKQFFRFWTDSMTSSPMTLHGDYDAAKRELTLAGEAFGMSGELEPCRTVTRFQDDDHVEWTLFGAGPDGKEIEQLRIEYTRAK